jgi:Icc-related predicted phosphoesterase
MKILAVSDIVEPTLYKAFDARRFEGIDLVLACGDLPPEYLRFLVSAFSAPLYYVRGNHDLRYDTSPPMGGTDLHGRLIRWNSLRLVGLEGSRWYNGGPNQYREAQMRGIIRRLKPFFWLRGRPAIVVTHAPPRHVGDGEDRCHRGFEVFGELIAKYRPRYFIHGHIHRHFQRDADRVTEVHATRVINAYGFVVLDYETGQLAGRQTL